MKNVTLKQMLVFGWIMMAATVALGQDVTVSQSSDAAEGLDLQSVGELFRESANAEVFEKKLNDPAVGINNIDLNEDGEVDYIRVVDQAEGDTHVLVLQVQLSQTDYQDVATIEVEKNGKDYEVQIHGNVYVYGPNVYLRPVGVNWATVAFVHWLYHPHYRPYVSPYRFGYYPVWWNPYRPVALSVYRSRTIIVAPRVRWNVYAATTVISARRVYIQPNPSPLVRKAFRHPVAAKKIADRPRVSRPAAKAAANNRVRTQSVKKTQSTKTTKTRTTKTRKKGKTTKTVTRTTTRKSR